MRRIQGQGNGQQGQGNGQQSQKKIDLKASRPIECDDCGYDIFVSGVKARKISKIAANTPQDVVIPFDVMLCGNCGEVIDELFPEKIKALEKLDEQRKNKKGTGEGVDFGNDTTGNIQF